MPVPIIRPAQTLLLTECVIQEISTIALHLNNKEYQMTASLELCSINSSFLSLDAMLKRAGKALMKSQKMPVIIMPSSIINRLADINRQPCGRHILSH